MRTGTVINVAQADAQEFLDNHYAYEVKREIAHAMRNMERATSASGVRYWSVYANYLDDHSE